MEHGLHILKINAEETMLQMKIISSSHITAYQSIQLPIQSNSQILLSLKRFLKKALWVSFSTYLLSNSTSWLNFFMVDLMTSLKASRRWKASGDINAAQVADSQRLSATPTCLCSSLAKDSSMRKIRFYFGGVALFRKMILKKKRWKNMTHLEWCLPSSSKLT